jgi:hypothetical protein
MTVQEYLEIYRDLDAYMARGGRLLDLTLVPLNEVPPEVQQLIAEELGSEKMARIGRFFRRVTALTKPNVEVGAACTEEELRLLWRESADHVH